MMMMMLMTLHIYTITVTDTKHLSMFRFWYEAPMSLISYS
jgi:hypothetical protein